jgi:predicted hydrocarbon binding protein
MLDERGTMGSRTVRVPRELEHAFEQAERVVAEYFAARRERPERGSIEISGERYLFVRAASLSVEFFALVRELYGPGRHAQADEFSRNLLYDLSHGLGRADARHFHARMGLTDPLARLAAGPVHFSHTGWAFVDIDPRSAIVAGPEYLLIYEHPHSFEADAWLAGGMFVDAPACIMNAGYSAGWCQESFGIRLVSAEVACRACGDSTCRFVMAPPDRIEQRLKKFVPEPSRPAGGRRPAPAGAAGLQAPHVGSGQADAPPEAGVRVRVVLEFQVPRTLFGPNPIIGLYPEPLDNPVHEVEQAGGQHRLVQVRLAPAGGERGSPAPAAGRLGHA